MRRGDLVTGVTTAATLWMMTVIGLCLGGGQIGLGMTATGLTILTLWALKWLDMWIPRENRVMLVVKVEPGSSSISDIPALLAPMGYKAQFRRHTRGDDAQQAKLSFEVFWRNPEIMSQPADLLKLVNERYQVVSFELTSESRH